MPTHHAILGPSSAYRWLTCTPSARFEEQLPDEETTFALEGTLAHDLAAFVLGVTYHGHDGGDDQILEAIEARVAEYYTSIAQPNAFTEMYEHAQAWADFVADFGGDLLIENEYDLSRFIPLGFGTADAVNITDDVLYVSDYKYGAGVRVSATNNSQLKIYGLGALLKAIELGHTPETVTLSIFQPRTGGPSSWSISVKDLLLWAETELAPKANLAIAGVGDFVPGKHCQFCKARTSCAAYYGMFAELLKIKDARVIQPGQRAKVLKYGGLVASWIKKVEEEAIRDLQAKKPINGYKLVAGRGVRKFKNEDDVVDTLIGEGYDTDDIFKTEIRALTDLEKALGKKRFEALFANLIINVPGKPTLAHEDDERPAIGASAADEYDDEELL